MRATERIIGNSPALHQALAHLSQLAPVNRPILVIGERGTGKELAAERLHYLSGRWDAPLVKVNCAAMAESLLESELFGHEAGAFTGAARLHRGHFEQADGGTLFLDELGTMSTRLQEKLLRLIEYGEFQRVGGHKTLQVDVRVVAATNADLRQMADAGDFRADLLDRLSFDVVHLPALRQRPEDIPELANHFALQMCAELGWELFPGFTHSAMTELERYPWPGNIRELKNAVERSIYRWEEPNTEVGSVVVDPFASPYTAVTPAEPRGVVDNRLDTAEVALPLPQNFSDHMQAIERNLLVRALAANGENQRRTADALGLTYDQLRGLVRKHGIGGKRQSK